MDPGMLHGLTSLPGHLPLWIRHVALGELPPKLTVSVTSEKCRNTSPRNTLAPIHHYFGFVIAFTIILIGIIVSQTVSFLTSIKTSLLSWKSNLGIPFAPGSKSGLYMSLWCEEFLDRIGNTPPAKSPPTTTPQSSSPNPYTALHDYPRFYQDDLAYISSGSEN